MNADEYGTMADSNGNGRSNGNGNNALTTGIAAGALLVSLIGMFWTNSKGDVNSVKYELREDINRAEDRVMKELSLMRTSGAAVVDKLLPVAEHKEFKEKTDRGIEQNNQDIRSLRGDLVSRAEHQQHWNDMNERISKVNEALMEERKIRADDVNAIRKDVGGTYTLGDVVKQLQDQIKQLNLRLDQLKPQAGISPSRAGVPPTAFYQPMKVEY